MNVWTANGKTFERLGVVGAVRSGACWDPHYLDLTLDGRNADAAALFAAREEVTIRYGSDVRFVGEVQGPGRRAEGAGEGQRIRLVNAWIALEETIYEQLWYLLNTTAASGTPVTARKARCVIGLKSDGTIGTLGEAIEDVLAFAGVAAGTIDLPQSEEPWEVRNVSCAEVLRQIQRLAPRSVNWWTYPGGVPTFHATATPDSVELAFEPETDAVDLVPNTEQCVRGVKLQYEVVRTTNDIPQTDVVEDTAGATTGRRVLMQTIPWRGAANDFLRQRVKVRTIHVQPLPTALGGSDADLKLTRKFWADRAQELRQAAPVWGDPDKTPGITFMPFVPVPAGANDNRRGQQPADTVGIGPQTGGQYYFAVQLAHKDRGDGATQYELADPDDTGSARTVLDPTLPRMLVEGTVTPWMLAAGKNAQRWVLHARVTWAGQGSPGEQGKMIAIKLTATDCVTKEYTSHQNYADGDPVPSGLAAELYAVLSEVYHEGTFERVETECSGFAREGHALTITGGAAEWETMHALVQAVQEDIVAGSTTLTIGVGKHLGTADMLDLLCRERKRKEADTGRGVTNAGSRKDGLP